MSERRPWWEGKRFPTLGSVGGVSPEIDDWALTAMSEDSLRNGVCVYSNSLNGSARMELEELVKVFTGAGGVIVSRRPPWRGDVQERVEMVWGDGVMVVWGGDGDMGGRVVTTNPALYELAGKTLEQAVGPKTSAGKIYVLMHTKDGPKLKSIGMAALPLERDNYNPVVLEDFDAVAADLSAASPSGRLAVFDGPTGSGKTHLMKGLLAAVPEALFVMVPVAMVPELASPGMIGALLEIRKDKGKLPTVFVIEDADNCLGSRREGSNVDAVSALLNLSDGIVGAMLDIRMVCSTNLKSEELDEAVKRPGRLSRLVHVGHLEKDVATRLYRKLTGNDKVKVDEKLTLAEVYSLARNDGWKPVPKKQAIGFSSTPAVEFEEDDGELEIVAGYFEGGSGDD